MGPLGRQGKHHLVAEINVTPLVDVMLVLLIIFMVTAPMMTEGFDVNLPTTTARPLRQQEEPLVVTIDKDGALFLGKVKVDTSLLYQQLAGLSEEKKQESIYLRADQEVPYGAVMATMATIKRAGFSKLGMVTRPPENGRQD